MDAAKKFAIILALLAIVQSLDFVTTMQAVKTGAIESNPIYSVWFVKPYFSTVFAIGKLVGIFLILPIAYSVYRAQPVARPLFDIVFTTILAITTIVVINNLTILFLPQTL